MVHSTVRPVSAMFFTTRITTSAARLSRAGRRLVQEEDGRVADQLHSDGEQLELAGRETDIVLVAHQPVLHGRQLQQVDQLVHEGLAGRQGHRLGETEAGREQHRLTDSGERLTKETDHSMTQQRAG